MAEKALDKKTLIATLTKSPHGNLAEYLPTGLRAAREEPDFFAHLVAWNHVKGQVRDAKVALPLIALRRYESNIYDENALAHLAALNPRLLGKVLLPSFEMTIEADAKRPKRKRIVRVVDDKGKPVERPSFATQAGAPTRLLRRLVTRYLRDLEADRRAFERAAVQHARVLSDLYAHYHVSRPAWVGEILFHGEKGHAKVRPPEGTIFAAIRNLRHMGPEEAAGTIAKYKIPFLVARGALGARAKDEDQVLALIRAMSPTELVTNMRWLESVGVKTRPALRAALEQALGRAAKAPAAATLKTSVAAETFDEDDKLAHKLQALQEKQLDNLGGIDGDWIVFADKSGSMSNSIEVARQITAALTRMVKGKVHLIFFDSAPYYHDATGKSLVELKAMTALVAAQGGTHMHCGVRLALDRGLHADGMVFIGDGANHGIDVMPTYRKYCEKMGVEPTLYFYQLAGEPDVFSTECRAAGVDLQTFDLRNQAVDYYSLPNLVKTMRVSRYQLLEEVMATPLRTLNEVLDRTVGMAVLPKVEVTA